MRTHHELYCLEILTFRCMHQPAAKGNLSLEAQVAVVYCSNRPGRPDAECMLLLCCRYQQDLDPTAIGYSCLADVLLSEFKDLVKLEIRLLPGLSHSSTVIVPLVTDATQLRERFYETQARVNAASADAASNHQVGGRWCWGGGMHWFQMYVQLLPLTKHERHSW